MVLPGTWRRCGKAQTTRQTQDQRKLNEIKPKRTEPQTGAKQSCPKQNTGNLDGGKQKPSGKLVEFLFGFSAFGQRTIRLLKEVSPRADFCTVTTWFKRREQIMLNNFKWFTAVDRMFKGNNQPGFAQFILNREIF